MLTKPVKDMYEKAKMTSGGAEVQFDEINLEVDAAQLRQAVDWLEKHKGEWPPAESPSTFPVEWVHFQTTTTPSPSTTAPASAAGRT
jgi:hypothetical protein